MGLHFVISKLYANSLLATLNTRKHLRNGTRNANSIDGGDGIPVILTHDFMDNASGSPMKRFTQVRDQRRSPSPMVHINVQKTVERTIDEGEPSPQLKDREYLSC